MISKSFGIILLMLAVSALVYTFYVSPRDAVLTKSAERLGPNRKEAGNGVGALSVAGTVQVGQRLFAQLCAACHGEDGKGKVGPDLTVSLFRYGKSRADIVQTISKGRPGGMPSFSSHLSKEHIELLAEYVLSLKQ